MTWKNWVLGAALTLAPAFAQTTFKVPFDFDAGGHNWSAGNYQVNLLSSGFAVIHNVDTRQNQIVLPVRDRSDIKDPASAALTFHQYGERYFLAKISVGENNGLKLQATPKERELASRVSPTVALIRAGTR